MNQVDYDLLNDMRISSGCVVVNQCGQDSVVEFDYRGYPIKWINSSEIGLSRSRNLAIKNSTADICVLADDDLVYVDEYSAHILNEFVKIKGADILAFRVDGIGRIFKTYPKSIKKLNFISSMKVSSVQIAFKRKRFIDHSFFFKEEFGAGSIFYAGEENVLLSECRRVGFKLYFVPTKVADLHMGDSTWFEGFNERYFIAKGASFTAMSKSLAILLIVQFAFRKRTLYQHQSTLSQALKSMLKGRRIYLSGKYDF